MKTRILSFKKHGHKCKVNGTNNVIRNESFKKVAEELKETNRVLKELKEMPLSGVG